MTIVIVGTLFLNFGLYSIYEYYVAMYGVCVYGLTLRGCTKWLEICVGRVIIICPNKHDVCNYSGITFCCIDVWSV